MNPELKAKWLEALRSGKFTQGRTVLKDSFGHYCCLGVLCEVAGLDLTKAEESYVDSIYPLLGTDFDRNMNEGAKLCHMNDDWPRIGGKYGPTKTIKEIADYIEANL